MILEAIGELQRVVAYTKYCADVVPEVRGGGRVILADSWTANADEIMAAKPDLVIASVPYQEKAVGEILKAGVAFLGLAPHRLADVYADIAMIAGIVGAGERGEAAIRGMQRRIEEVRAQTSIRRKRRVFCEEWGKPIISSQTWVAELVEAAGGEFLSVPGGKNTAEEIAKLDPEIVIAAWCGAGDRVPLEKIIRERRWQETTAARDGAVFCIRDEFLNTPAPTLLQGLDAIASAIHPDIFPVTKGIRRITEVSEAVVGNPKTVG